MTIQECYQELGGSYEEVAKRLPSAALIKKFISKFPNDDSFNQLKQAMADGKAEEAFRAAHTLKGVCGNLNFDTLGHSTSILTEVLRAAGDVMPAEAPDLFVAVESDYAQTVKAIETFLAEG
ncbi:MAG: Hpt domain-containing protein [Lachnospiraceae bacterium]|nr:Hpt domain-containing protein [Lachnospiraceae bacterium]